MPLHELRHAAQRGAGVRRSVAARRGGAELDAAQLRVPQDSERQEAGLVAPARDGEGEEEEVEVVDEEDDDDEESMEEDGGIRLDASVVAELGVRLDVEDGAGGLSALQDLDDAALLRLVGGEEGACEALKAQLAAISEPGAA